MNETKFFDAEARSLRYLNQLNELEIPFFQRPYVWEEENWKKLYESFFDNAIPDFLGSIILKHNTNGESQSTIVIDGQQRLTTMSLFVKATYDSLPEKDRIIYKPELLQILYRYLEEVDENGNPKMEPRIKHSYLDKKSFDIIMNNFENNEIVENSNDRIISCYLYFKSRLENETYEEKIRIIKMLLKSNTTIFVGIIVYSYIDEQKVFDTLNNAGVRLTITDTIKNYLFRKASQIISNGAYGKDVIELYDEYWNSTFNLRKEKNGAEEDVRKKWEQEIPYGRIYRNVSDLFLQAFATIKGFYKPEDTIDNLAQKYKDKIDNLTTKDDIVNFLNDIKEYGDIYYDNFVKEKSNSYSYKDDVKNRLLMFTNILDSETLNIYILHVLVKYKDNKEKQNELLHYVEKMILITHLGKNLSRSKNYNKLCVDFIKNEDRLLQEIKEMEDPSIACYNGLFGIKEDLAKALLFFIELYRRSSKYQDIDSIEFKPSYQLEHIMPKKWETYWNWLPTIDSSGNEIEFEENIEEDEKIRIQKYNKDRIIKSLGNMTILNGDLNNKIKNKSIDIKVDGNSEKGYKGIREYVDFKITKEDVVDYYDNAKEWKEEHIIERNKDLLKEIIEALMY